MINKKPQIRLEPNDSNTVKIKTSETSVVLYLSLLGTPYKAVIWSISCGFSKKTYIGGETVIVNIPSSLCGNQVLVKAVYRGDAKEKKHPFQKVSMMPEYTVFQSSPFLKENTLERTIYIEQETSIKSIFWKDANGIILGDILHRLLLRRVRIVVSATGFNNKTIFYAFKVNEKQLSSTYTTIVSDDSVVFSANIPDEYLEDDKKNIKIELVITRDNEEEVITQFRKYRQYLVKEIAFNDYLWSFTTTDAYAEIEPVVVYGIQVNDNNFMPCKFTEVKLTTISDKPSILNELFQEMKNRIGEQFEIESLIDPPKKEEYENSVVVFDELYSKATRDKTPVVYPIVAGSEEVDLVLSVKNFDLDKCKIHKYELSSNREQIELKNTSGKNYEYRHSVYYPYVEIFNPFVYFWPTFAPIKKQLVMHSCRHFNVRVDELIYPDIKWSLGFHITGKVNEKTRKIELDCGFSFAAAWDNDSQSFSFSVKYPFNNAKEQMLETIKLRAAIQIREQAVDFLDSFTDGGAGYLITALTNLWRFFGSFLESQFYMEEYYRKKQGFLDLLASRKTVDIGPMFPKFSFGASWAATTHQRQIGLNLAAAMKGVLAGIKGTVDLYACAGKIPQIKAFIEGTRWLMENFLQIETKFEITFEGTIGGSSDMSYNTASLKGKNELYIEGKVDLSVKLEASQESSRSASIEIETYGADGETGVFVKIYLRKFAAGQEPDTPKEGIYGDLKAGMNELQVGIFKEKVVKEKGRGDASEPDDEIESCKIENKVYLFGGKKTLLDKINFVSQKGKPENDFIRFFIR
ncbi:MAG: hypothetical protein RL662_462 [Bacteroidota bacterium]|jgi:hypothetical protein